MVVVDSDSAFQARLRTQQSLWREAHGLPIGNHNGVPLGSRLRMPDARNSLANFLTPGVRSIVREELEREEAGAGQGKLYGMPRLVEDLLSSQPLCFNLFGELKLDLRLATAVGRLLWPDAVDKVTGIEFEWSPGRGDAAYLGNNSAFDVVLFHSTPHGGSGFTGIEVKYHEDLRVKAANHKPRYDEVAAASGVFGLAVSADLGKPPLQQLWLDHLLALSMTQHGDFDFGRFVVLHPVANLPCARAVADYTNLLADRATFDRRTLEEVVAAITWSTDASWIREFAERYLVR